MHGWIQSHRAEGDGGGTRAGKTPRVSERSSALMRWTVYSHRRPRHQSHGLSQKPKLEA